MDAKTDAFLGAHASVVTLLPQASAQEGNLQAGVTPKGAPVVFRDASLEECLGLPQPRECVSAALDSIPPASDGGSTRSLVVASENATTADLLPFLAVMRSRAGVTLTSTLPTSGNPAAVAEVPVARIWIWTNSPDPVHATAPVPVHEAAP